MADVTCPHCGGVLFRIRAVSNDGQATGKHPDDPGIDNDGSGNPFATCPHCKKQVRMQFIGGGPSGTQVRVHPVQK